MKIAIISDIHENSHNLRLFLKEAEKLKVEKIIFLWDFVAKKMAWILAFSKYQVMLYGEIMMGINLL